MSTHTHTHTHTHAHTYTHTDTNTNTDIHTRTPMTNCQDSHQAASRSECKHIISGARHFLDWNYRQYDPWSRETILIGARSAITMNNTVNQRKTFNVVELIII